jgi:putative hydrolase of the HAD superfamily
VSDIRNTLSSALILDLDNTIFPTSSLSREHFTGFLDHLSAGLSDFHAAEEIERIITDLWIFPWDHIISRYDISKPLFMRSVEVLEGTTFNFSIKTFPDYHHLRAIDAPKFLVTTSVPNLQRQKIKALGIENDFKKIHIQNSLTEAGGKLEVFSRLAEEYKLLPRRTFVIGDNPDSELEAGKWLGMVTIQMLRPGISRGGNADHHISSFEELDGIVKSRE